MKEKTSEQIIEEISLKIESALSGADAVDILLDYAEKGILNQKNGILFKTGEFFIQNIFYTYGKKYEENIRLLNTFNLDIIPKHIRTIIKDNEMFIITKTKGCKNGDLLHFIDVSDNVSNENKMKAYSDLKKLTENGYTDDSISCSPKLWFVSPDDMQIVLPSFENLREIIPGEEEKVLSGYKYILEQ